MKFYSIFSELLIIWKQFVEIIRNMLPKRLEYTSQVIRK